MRRQLSPQERRVFEKHMKKAQRRKRPRSTRDAVLVLLVCILLLFLGAVLIRFLTRGPRVVKTATKPTTTKKTFTHATAITITATSMETSSTSNTKEPTQTPTPTMTTTETVESTTVDQRKPHEIQPGNEMDIVDLGEEIKPQRYEVTFTLNGTNLAHRSTRVNGRVEASLEALKATSKVILKADSGTIKEVKMALLEVPAGSEELAEGLPISTLSVSDPFLIAELEKPLEAGKSYKLIVDYYYDKVAEGGPISLSAGLAKMRLKVGEVHAAFPCFEKTGWNIPVVLTLLIPKEHTAVANTPLDGEPTVVGTLSAHKFEVTPPSMPLDMLAWAAFPTSLKVSQAVPSEVNIYAHSGRAALIKSAKKAFVFLRDYFQSADKQLISKIDFVLTKTPEAQESLGFAVLDPSATKETVCSKIANQWTGILMRQPETPTWIGSAGVTYLCRLAVVHVSLLPELFLTDLNECKKDKPAPGTRELLAFRMVHFILGDAKLHKALQKYVADHAFKSTTIDEELAAFEPDIRKDHLRIWLREGYRTKKLERKIGNAKSITWKNQDDTPTPFATATDNGIIRLQAPSAIAVAWLDKSRAEAPVSVEDKEPLYVNPSMMACYGIEMDNASWSLIGDSISNILLDRINRWYLVEEAVKQFKNAEWPDYVSFMWTWPALNKDYTLWEQHVDLISDIALKAHRKIISAEDEAMFWKRISDTFPRGSALEDMSYESANKVTKLACEATSTECGTHTKFKQVWNGRVYDTVLNESLNETATAAFPVPYGLRERALYILMNTTAETSTEFDTFEKYVRVLNTAADLHLIRTEEELEAVNARAADSGWTLPDETLKTIKNDLVTNYGQLRAWLERN